MWGKGTNMEKQIIFQPVCYFTTPEYLNTFWGKRYFIYSKGSSQLTNTHIRFRSKKIDFDIPMNSITDMSIGTFERTKGIFHLNYLAIIVSTKSGPKTILLVPAQTRFTPSWAINRTIEQWFNTISNIKVRKYEMYRPYPFTHDWPDKLKKNGKQVHVENISDKEEYGISNIPTEGKMIMVIILLTMMIMIIGGVMTQDAQILAIGAGGSFVVLITFYIYFYIQHRILSHVRKNKDKNILFNMWAEFEEREFMGPFKGKK